MQIEEPPIDKMDEDSSNQRFDFGDEAEQANLAESLAKQQDSPITLCRLEGGRFKVIDGHRRLRAAKRAGLKTLKAIILEKDVSKAETKFIQLRSDIHKKSLTGYERAQSLLELEKANPGLTGKQLAALINFDENLLWKYLRTGLLCPESLQAFKEGKIGLTVVVELAKPPHDEQPILLNLKGGKITREDVRASRKKADKPRVRAARLKIPIPAGRLVTVKGAEREEISLEESADTLKVVLKLVTAAISKSYNVKTAERVWADTAAAN